jgi:hypothetical protein
MRMLLKVRNAVVKGLMKAETVRAYTVIGTTYAVRIS